MNSWHKFHAYSIVTNASSMMRDLYAHKLNPICDNCSNDVSRDRSNRGVTRDAKYLTQINKTNF